MSEPMPQDHSACDTCRTCLLPIFIGVAPADVDGEFSDKPGLMHIAQAESRILKYRIRIG